MKRSNFILIFLICSNYIIAQRTSVFKNMHLVQLNYHSTIGNNIEFGYMYFSNKAIGTQIKGSYRNYEDDIHPYFNSELTYIKPGFVLLLRDKPTGVFYIGVNSILGYSIDNINIAIGDPILGYTIQKFSETNHHVSLELEANYLAPFNNYIAVNFGIYGGRRLIDPEPFKSKFNGHLYNHQVVRPGTGFKQIFIGINIGLVVSLNKN